MEYCVRCLYPANAKPTIIYDDEGVCSGCRYHESRSRIDWEDREKMLKEILKEAKIRSRELGSRYDCIIPVSGGKDSHYQTYLIKVVHGLNPLLVTYNHTFNTRLGIRNLNNLVDKFGCDLIRFTANTQSVRKISKLMLQKVGDLTWHYHAGIRTFPFQVAVQQQIPLIIWGEHGFAELTGQVTLEDMVEFTKWTRLEHDMRGYEPYDLISEETGINENDITPYIYPSDEQIESLNIRGIYLSNFFSWDALQQVKLMKNEFDFAIHSGPRDRSFNLYGKTDDHANDVHDYLKYLKFGYGRATDDASTEIRHGRMTREQGIALVKRYDHVKPGTLDTYLKFMGITKSNLMDWIEPMRDTDIWEKHQNEWRVNDSVVNHADGQFVDNARVSLVLPDDRTFGGKNAGYYWHDKSEAAEFSDSYGRQADDRNFIVL